jgi:hypothetical protein
MAAARRVVLAVAALSGISSAAAQTAETGCRLVADAFGEAGYSIVACSLQDRGWAVGETRRVAIFALTFENAEGGNSHGSGIAAIVPGPTGPSLRFGPPELEPFPAAIAAARIRGGRIVVDGWGHGPDDPHCCPSQRQRVRLEVGPEGLRSAMRRRRLVTVASARSDAEPPVGPTASTPRTAPTEAAAAAPSPARSAPSPAR